MPISSRAVAATAVTTLALTTLAACGSTSHPRPATPPADTNAQITKTATAFMHAWMAVQPSDGTTMCQLQTKAARPNYSSDGGTLSGCIATWKQRAADNANADGDSNRAPLQISISNIQDVPASSTHPAGKGVLATMHRAGETPFRYALRLVQDGGDQWHIEQKSDVGDPYAHTADPVAPVLAQAD